MLTLRYSESTQAVQTQIHGELPSSSNGSSSTACGGEENKTANNEQTDNERAQVEQVHEHEQTIAQLKDEVQVSASL